MHIVLTYRYFLIPTHYILITRYIHIYFSDAEHSFGEKTLTSTQNRPYQKKGEADEQLEVPEKYLLCNSQYTYSKFTALTFIYSFI